MTSAYVLSHIAAHPALPEGTTLGNLQALTGLVEHLGDGAWQLTTDGWDAIERLGRNAIGQAS